MHRVLVDPDQWPAESDALIEIEGDEAHHAIRVKRLEPGATIELLDGVGGRASARLAHTRKVGKQGWAMELDLEAVRREPEPARTLRVISGVPKGPRLDAMIESLSQVGVDEWCPLRSSRSVVDPREGKLGRMARIASESIKQCGRAWAMRIGEAVSLASATERGGTLVVADADARPAGTGRAGWFDASGHATLVVGPEGGLDDRELGVLRDAGAVPVCFGRHTMRTETAAVVAAANILLERCENTGVPS